MLRKTRWLLAFLPLVVLLVPASCLARPGLYDAMIAASAAEYMPEIDWRLWKAQVQAESAFRDNATSPVGAMGLSQVMPATFREISERAGIRGNPYDPVTNLRAGAFYMSRQRAAFKAPRPDFERHNLALGAYNAGLGNIIKAQKMAGNPAEWDPVAEKLPLVTGRHAKETIDYVKKIRSFHRAYLIYGN